MSLAQRISAPALLLLTGKTQPYLESRTFQQADVELRLKHMLLLLLDLKHTCLAYDCETAWHPAPQPCGDSDLVNTFLSPAP